MVAIWRNPDTIPKAAPIKRALYTEQCQDDDGKRYTVIVWRDWPGSPQTSYTLEDGTLLHYEDERYFALPSGRMLSRCEDA